MKRYSFFTLLVMSTSLVAQTVPTGSYSLPKKTASGYEQKAMPSTPGTIWSNDGSGNPAVLGFTPAWGGSGDDNKLLQIGPGGAIQVGPSTIGGLLIDNTAVTFGAGSAVSLDWNLVTTPQTVSFPDTSGILAMTGDPAGRVNLADTLKVFGNLPVSRLNSGTNASAISFWAGDGTWKDSSTFAAPPNASFITRTAESGLSNEFALSTLTSGIMRVNQVSGAVTSLNTSAGISTNITDETGSGFLVFNDAPAFTTRIGLPTSSVPTTSTAGQTAFDTNAMASGRGAVQVFDGTAVTYLLGMLASDLPSSFQRPARQADGSVQWTDAGLTANELYTSTGTQTVDQLSDTVLDPGSLGIPLATVGTVPSDKYLVFVTIEYKYNNVSTSSDTGLYFAIKDSSNIIIADVVLQMGTLTSYSAPTQVVTLPLVFYAPSGLTDLTPYCSLTQALTGGTITVQRVNGQTISVSP